MAPKRKTNSPTAAAAANFSSPKAKKKPNRRRKLRYTVRKNSKKASNTSSSPFPALKKGRNEEEVEQQETSAAVVDEVAVMEAAARLIIEHSKQCTSFTNQVAKFEKSLKGKIEGLEKAEKRVLRSTGRETQPVCFDAAEKIASKPGGGDEKRNPCHPMTGHVKEEEWTCK